MPGAPAGLTHTVTATYAHASALLALVQRLPHPPGTLVVTLHEPGPVDLALLDVIARLTLRGRAAGWHVEIEADDPALSGLAAVTGLDRVLRMGRSGQDHGEAEPHEDVVAQEVVDVGDAPL